jgi:exodeoxyribonuclease VII large subunit
LPEVKPYRVHLNEDARRMNTSITTQIAQRRQALAALASQLELLNPQRTLERGYAMVLDSKGNIVRSPKKLHPRETVTMRLAEGSAEVGIASVQPLLD